MKKIILIMCLLIVAILVATIGIPQNHGVKTTISPGTQSKLQSAVVNLTEKKESKNFIFHFKLGDSTRSEIERSEAYHRWAIGYLGVTPSKKIDYYLFPSMEEMNKAFGVRFGGSSFPKEFALVTAFSWHNHECFHLYTSLIGYAPRIFAEGMVIAHEFDPYNNAWVSQWNRARPYPEPHIEIARRLRFEGRLYPLDSILESDDFNAQVSKETVKIAYEQAGAWVSYLIEKYGLDKMKKIIAGIPYYASKDEIKAKFKEVYSISIDKAELAWLSWLNE